MGSRGGSPLPERPRQRAADPELAGGHTLLKVFGGFVVALGFLGIGPLFVTVALYGLELIVAGLQAYVFAVLTCLYLNDALHLHH